MNIQLNTYKKISFTDNFFVYIKGYAFHGDTLCNEDETANILINAIKSDTLKTVLYNLKGNFSAVITNDDSTYLIADKIRSYPLIYSVSEGLIVTDSVSYLLDNKKDISFSEINKLKILSLHYLDQGQTLLENVFAVEPGNYVCIQGENRKEIEYHNFIYPKKYNLSEDEILKQSEIVASNALNRVLKSIGTKRIVLSLSGGYDSRYVACLLKKAKVENVLCYSYGLKDSYETKVSKQVAQKLGYEWHCVEYTSEKRKKSLTSEQVKKHIINSTNLTAVTHLQDFLAIEELFENGIINSNDVIMTGYCGDVLGGSNIVESLFKKGRTIANVILRKNGNISLREKYAKKVQNSFVPIIRDTDVMCDIENTVSEIDNWNVNTQSAKFIVNWVRTYELFGMSWRAPLMDDEVYQFWFSLGWERRREKIYEKCIFKTCFEEYNVDIKKEQVINENIIGKILSLFPERIILDPKERIRKLLNLGYMSDVNGSKSYEILLEDCDKKIIKKYLKNYIYGSNTITAIYLIDKLTKSISNKK